MNTNFKNKFLTGAMLFSALLMGSSCDDSIEGLKVTPETPFADKTLYEVITNDADLTQFVDVINSCGSECADSLFNHSRVYTVWAPVNGSFNKDSLIQEVANGNREAVFNTFVKAHVANFLKPATGKLENDNLIMLLNNKMARFEGDHLNGYSFSGCAIDEANIRVVNGIIHKIEKASEYKYNIWEYLKVAENIDSVATYLYSFNEYKFNEGQSLKGPIVEGVQTYLDSVFDFKNMWLDTWNGLGNLNYEDSLYTAYIPTNEVWVEQVALADKYFNYNRTSKIPAKMDSTYRDSLRFYYPRQNVLKYLTYSQNEQIYVKSPDSIMPVCRDGERKQFLAEQLNRNIYSTKELSNGVFNIINEFPFSPLELWHDTIFVEGENTNMINRQTANVVSAVKTAYKNQINKDSAFVDAKISGSAYYQIGDENTKTALTLEYAIPNMLSAKYKLALILVPRNIVNSNIKEDELLDVVISVKVSQNSKQIKSINNIKVNPTRVDTVFLADSKGDVILSMPNCEYYKTGSKDDYSTSVEIKTVRSNKRDMSLRLDKIMFIPVMDE